jgi:ribonuclease HII
VLVDGNRLPRWDYAARAIVGGDASHPEISAASIIAKEHRDHVMREAALQHPEYGWEKNAGYGTAMHMAALREHGPTAFHRRSFAPIAQLMLI